MADCLANTKKIARERLERDYRETIERLWRDYRETRKTWL